MRQRQIADLHNLAFPVLQVPFYTSSESINGVTAYKQIRRCIMKFCQIDKMSICICLFDNAETIKMNKISIVAADRLEYMKYIVGLTLILALKGHKRDCRYLLFTSLSIPYFFSYKTEGFLPKHFKRSRLYSSLVFTNEKNVKKKKKKTSIRGIINFDYHVFFELAKCYH